MTSKNKQINWIQDYIEHQLNVLEYLPSERIGQFINLLEETLSRNKQIFVFGNGGSAANASHFATDLGKGASDKLSRRFRIMSLTDNMPWITAIANDYDYKEVFVNQLKNFANDGDVAVGLSVSGNSPNCVAAFGWAFRRGLRTVALTGQEPNTMTKIADLSIIVNSKHYGIVEDAHMTICHIVANYFMEK